MSTPTRDESGEPSRVVEAALVAMRNGDSGAAERLLPHVYDELLRIARRCFRGQPAGHTLQPTILVHEAYARLVGADGGPWKDRAHFLAVAATAMRQILVSHSRKRDADKRGGDRDRVPLEDVMATIEAEGMEIVVLDDLLARLAALSKRQARIVELRVFGGLTLEETAHVLDLGVTTVKDEWQFARAWLARELSRE